MSFVYGYNTASQANTLQLGFTQEGLLREHLFHEDRGEHIDMYQNGLLQHEFRQNKRLSRLSKRLLGHDVTQKPEAPQQMTPEQLQNAQQTLQTAIREGRFMPGRPTS